MNAREPTLSTGVHAGAIDIPYKVWSSPGVDETTRAPLLLVHDGPEYDERSGLTDFLAQQVRQGVIPPHRTALIEPVMGKRNDWYGASPDYTNDFARVLVPSILDTHPTDPSIIGMGASLGAVSMLGIAHESPSLFSGLYLQSGSFHHPNLDTEQNSYEEYYRVALLVEKIVKSPASKQTLEIGMTCGNEANLLGNIVMAAALASQGHNVSFRQNTGKHAFEEWGKIFTPTLTELLRCAWMKHD